MKKEILDRIKELGGNISEVKGVSLQKDLEAITFDTVLYPKPKDSPWATAEETEPIHGIGELIEANRNLLESNKGAFYDKIVNHYYKITEEGFGQTFYKKELFTPFKAGTPSYEEWNGEWKVADFKKVIIGSKMELMIIAHSYGFPDSLFICLTAPNQENPTVYGTDHEVYFDEITQKGTLEDFFNSFMTKEELINLLKAQLEE